MFSSETEQRGMRGIWHGGNFKIQHIKCKMKWGLGMRGGVKLTVRCSATLWAQMAPALLWGKQFHSHWGHSSSEQMQLFYCNVLWTEITGECHLAGKQDELDGVMLFGWIYWLCSHGLQNHIFTVLLNTNLVLCYVRWRKVGTRSEYMESYYWLWSVFLSIAKLPLLSHNGAGFYPIKQAFKSDLFDCWLFVFWQISGLVRFHNTCNELLFSTYNAPAHVQWREKTIAHPWCEKINQNGVIKEARKGAEENFMVLKLEV